MFLGTALHPSKTTPLKNGENMYETDFENFTALSDGNAAGIKTWGGWTVDEALVKEVDFHNVLTQIEPSTENTESE